MKKFKTYEKVIKFQDRSPSGINQSIWRRAGVAHIGLMRNSGRKWTKKGNEKVKQVVKKPV